MKKVYVETSVLSFLCADPSLVLATAARQQATHEWWTRHRLRYESYVSSEVVLEASQGNADGARKRLENAAELLLIAKTSDDAALASELIRAKLLPKKAAIDAAHLAIAARTKMDFLLTWNLKHLANPVALPMVYDYLKRNGLHVPVITTPSDLMESLK